MSERRKFLNLYTVAAIWFGLLTLLIAYKAYETYLVTENRDRIVFDMQLNNEIFKGQRYKLVAFTPMERDEEFKSYWATVHAWDDRKVFEYVYLYEIGNSIRQGKHYAEQVSASEMNPEFYGVPEGKR